MKKLNKLLSLLMVFISILSICIIEFPANKIEAATTDSLLTGCKYYLRHHASGSGVPGGGFLTSGASLSSEEHQKRLWTIDKYLDGYVIHRDGQYLKYYGNLQVPIITSDFSVYDYESYLFDFVKIPYGYAILPRVFNGQKYLTKKNGRLDVEDYTGNETYPWDAWYVINPFQVDSTKQYYIRHEQTGLNLHNLTSSIMALEPNTNATKIWKIDGELIKNGENCLTVRDDGSLYTKSNYDENSFFRISDNGLSSFLGNTKVNITTNGSNNNKGLSIVEQDGMYTALISNNLGDKWILDRVHTPTVANNNEFTFEITPFAYTCIKIDKPATGSYEIRFSEPISFQIITGSSIYFPYSPIESSGSSVVIDQNMVIRVRSSDIRDVQAAFVSR